MTIYCVTATTQSVTLNGNNVQMSRAHPPRSQFVLCCRHTGPHFT